MSAEPALDLNPSQVGVKAGQFNQEKKGIMCAAGRVCETPLCPSLCLKAVMQDPAFILSETNLICKLSSSLFLFVLFPKDTDVCADSGACP